MLRGFAPLKRSKVERLRLPALFAFDQCLTDALDLKAVFLLAPDEVADCIAVIGVAAGVDLGGDPSILMFGQGYGFTHDRHIGLHVIQLVLYSALDGCYYRGKPITTPLTELRGRFASHRNYAGPERHFSRTYRGCGCHHDVTQPGVFVVKTRKRTIMIDLSYRPRLIDLQPLTRSNFGLQLFEPEGVRTSEAGTFRGREGYNEDFLPGFAVPLPDARAIAGDVLPVTGSESDRLDYEHFSILMSKSRRLASSPPSI
ncbi:hypothetical protein QFZ54_003591 [Sphingomonas faeni]|nr:hypothetical protein [Sphingomonas faeni]MDQ0839739.1 hypothetical protein [Sphingomonas faeni]